VNDVCSRTVIGQADYGDVWTDVDLEVEFEPENCSGCNPCLVEEACPMRAVKSEEGKICRDEALCFHCGLCASVCPSAVFSCRLGAIRLKRDGAAVRSIPVVLRQSDRLRAERLAEDLKRKILGGDFKMTMPVGTIR
jgi:Fe-S-cluster-containing hydrogenase component 2